MVTDFLDKIAHVVLIMVNYVMWFAPLGVLGAVAAAVAKYGSEYLPFMHIIYWRLFWVLQRYGRYYLESVIWY